MDSSGRRSPGDYCFRLMGAATGAARSRPMRHSLRPIREVLGSMEIDVCAQ